MQPFSIPLLDDHDETETYDVIWLSHRLRV